MKYGIQANYDDGSVKWVSSTRWSTPSFSDDITNIAIFVQEQSAVTAVKNIRKDGKEPDDCVLEVVEITVKVERNIQVEYPPLKTGFLLIDVTLPSGMQYFIGTKNPGVYSNFNHFGVYQRATEFKTEQAAVTRHAQLFKDAEDNLQQTIDSPYLSHWLNQEQRKAAHDKQIEDATKLVERIKYLKVVKV